MSLRLGGPRKSPPWVVVVTHSSVPQRSIWIGTNPPAQKPKRSADIAASGYKLRVYAGPNGEVEGAPRSALQAPRAHTVLPRPRRVTTSRSRSPPLLGRAASTLTALLYHRMRKERSDDQWRSDEDG